MMRALFASLSFSLLAGCAVAPAGESAAEELAPPDAVEQSAASDAVAFSG
ncbi:hypothetical protein WME97_03475 [Sorangium sp. So ce367]